jgi:hypothetical protein
MLYFYQRGEHYAAAIPFFWLGQSMINVSVYVKDARTLELPLVSIGGSGDAIHDWHWMLSRLGLLQHDQLIGNLFVGAGVCIMLGSALIAAFLSVDPPDEKDETFT